MPSFRLRRHSRWLLPLSLLVIALAFRLYRVDAPIFDYHTFRQTETATIAKNFYLNGYNILHPQLNSVGPQPVDVSSEFPIYAFLVALGYGVFGIHEVIGRLLSVAFAAGTTLILYRLVARMEDRETGYYAALFFALSPYGIFFTRTFMPESTMLFFSVAALLSFHYWLEKQELSRFALAASCASLMILAKLPAVHIGVPLLYLAIHRFKWRFFLVPWLWAFAVFALAPAIGWYAYAWELGQRSGITFAVFSSADPVGWVFVFDPQFRSLVADWLLRNVLTLPGLGLAALGFLGLVQSRWRGFYLSWLIAVAFYLIIGAKGLVVNDYYVLPAVIALAPLVGLGAKRLRCLWGFGRRRVIRTLGQVVVVGVFGSVALLSMFRLDPLYEEAAQTITAGRAVDQLVEPDASIIAAGAGVPELLYAAKRHGWAMFRDKFTTEEVAALRQKGAQYFLTIDREWMLAQADFVEVVRQYPVVAATKDYLLLRLSPSTPTRQSLATRQEMAVAFAEKVVLLAWSTEGDPSVDHTIRFLPRWVAWNLSGDDLRYSVRLLDDERRVWGQVDSAFLGGFYPSTMWTAGETVGDYVEMPVLAGTPPETYQLEMRVYDGRTGIPLLGGRRGEETSEGVRLGTLIREPYRLAGALPKDCSGNPLWSNGKLRLLSGKVGQTTLRAGVPDEVDLLWEAQDAPKEVYTAVIGLDDGARNLTASTERRIGGPYPSSEWEKGDLVRDRIPLSVSPRLAAGSYDLALRLMSASGQAVKVNLGKVRVEVPVRSFEAPDPHFPLTSVYPGVAKLKGFDVKKVNGVSITSLPTAEGFAFEPGGGLDFVLHWQAVSEVDRSYTVYLQVLNSENRPVAQHDGIPATTDDRAHSLRPTNSWLGEEIVLDHARIDLPQNMPPGRYSIIAGLYDAETGQRLTTDAGSDYILLGYGSVKAPD